MPHSKSTTILVKHHTYLFSGHGTNDVRVTRICDCQRADPEVFTTCCSKLNVVAGVVMDTSFCQHGIVFNLGLPAIKQTTLVKETKFLL